MIFTYFNADAQVENHTYSRVKIDLTETHISEIAKLGLEADHGIYKKGRYFINDFSSYEIKLLKDNNIDFEIQIDDVEHYYAHQNDADHTHDHDHGNDLETRAIDCDAVVGGNRVYETPANYVYGSMGGYLTYSEAMVELDRMASLYPNLISAKAPIGNIVTHEGRPIHWLRISDNPNIEEDEPEVLYTALHHAREPNSLAQMVFYMWYLLENYETDAEVKYLVDNTEMYFIPVVNPDGYVFNEMMRPEGGGLWRKNRYVDEDGEVKGVDLNRNYGYKWGFDNQGSSNNPNRETYRGTEGFSEPETQAVRDFCNAHTFQVTLNYHTFGNLLIYPWGYSDQPTEEHDVFTAFARLMTRDNNYNAGTGTETVGYTVNGDSDDWMYGDTMSKPPIYSLTPEAGPQNFGFWPPQDAIDGINKENVLQNLTAAHLLLNYGQVKEVINSAQLTEREGNIELEVAKYGLQEGDLTLRVFSSDNSVFMIGQDEIVFTLPHMGKTVSNFEFMLADEVKSGDEIEFVVELDNGQYVISDTINKIFIEGEETVVLTEDGQTANAWEVNGLWATTNSSFVSGPSSITDSPIGNYDDNETNVITLMDQVDLGLAKQATLSFYTRWDIEAGFDFVQILASKDGVNYEALCGDYTKNAVQSEVINEPIYDGVQNDWVLEVMDLSDYLGEQISLRFVLRSDGYVTGDGFYFDDLKVEIVGETSSNTNLPNLVSNLEVFPNPFQESFNLKLDLLSNAKNINVRLVNSLGELVDEVKRSTLPIGNHQMSIGHSDITEGIYYLHTTIDNVNVGVQKVVKM